MPTGYTAKLCEGKQSFKDFAMQCARAFGALITMRDDDMDAKIPDEFKPSSYYEKASAKAIAKYKKLYDMSIEQRIKHGTKLKKQNIKLYKEMIAKEEAIAERVEAMIDEVHAWEPPSPDHQNLKDFMLDQLEMTLKHDGPSDFTKEGLAKAEAMDPMEYYTEDLHTTKDVITYYDKQHLADISRASEATEWVNKLRKSLEE